MDQSEQRGRFNSNFGFLMAAIGSAVGLGNLWGFPYKMGAGGGFAFLIIYLATVLLVGYPLMIGEFAIGRKTRRAPVSAYRLVRRSFGFVGWFASITPFFLLMFYVVLGGYCIKYLFANLGDIFGASWGVGNRDSGAYFTDFAADRAQTVALTLLFLLLTMLIVISGVRSGIERFSVIAMPALFVMLVITVIRSLTLPGASAGLAFMFRPDFRLFRNGAWLRIAASAGGQMFFSLSLASGCHISFGSYLDKKEDLQLNAIIVPAADTAVALMAGLATLPAVFASGLEPAGGPGMLFVVLQKVFQQTGSFGPFFGTLFYLLVFLAALTSSIGMLEGTVSTFIDLRLDKGKKGGRTAVTLIICLLASSGAVLTAADALGSGGLPHIFGQSTWLDTFDLFGEGLLMPLGGFFMAVLLGWVRRHYIDDEIRISSSYGSARYVDICLKFFAPLFMLFIIVIQLDAFFKLRITDRLVSLLG